MTLLHRTALDPVAIGAVASGQVSGKAISVTPRWTPNSRFEAFNVYEASTEFKDFVARELLRNPDSPTSRTVFTFG
jgi:hypothetical protein